MVAGYTAQKPSGWQEQVVYDFKTLPYIIHKVGSPLLCEMDAHGLIYASSVSNHSGLVTIGQFSGSRALVKST